MVNAGQAGGRVVENCQSFYLAVTDMSDRMTGIICNIYIWAEYRSLRKEYR
jgi:hypothetical protein